MRCWHFWRDATLEHDATLARPWCDVTLARCNAGGATQRWPYATLALCNGGTTRCWRYAMLGAMVARRDAGAMRCLARRDAGAMWMLARRGAGATRWWRDTMMGLCNGGAMRCWRGARHSWCYRWRYRAAGQPDHVASHTTHLPMAFSYPWLSQQRLTLVKRCCSKVHKLHRRRLSTSCQLGERCPNLAQEGGPLPEGHDGCASR